MTKKYTHEEVVNLIHEKGYELISEYMNFDSLIEIKDKHGFYYMTFLGNLLKNYCPRKFNISNLYTIQNIKLWCELNNKPFKLISEKYEGINTKLKWQCLKESCREIFDSTLNDITHQGSGCSYCAGQTVGLSNSLATRYPDLILEWHQTKNGTLTPYDITWSSGKKVWWQCRENPEHEWEETIPNRNKRIGCPYCTGKRPSKNYSLLIINPELVMEWNYDKNKFKPDEYTPNSNKKVWWKCLNCGNEWFASINSRSNGTDCPECNKSKGENKISDYLFKSGFIKISQEDYNVLNNQNKNYFIPQKTFNDLVGLGNGLLSYDFWIPNNNLLIEYQGEQHERYIKGFHRSKKDFERQQEHDRRKREYSKLHNINLLEIWYWDFDNIEQILNKTLSEKSEGVFNCDERRNEG